VAVRVSRVVGKLRRGGSARGGGSDTPGDDNISFFLL
jgi:hypothetical protein